jgi:hypothetical protein
MFARRNASTTTSTPAAEPRSAKPALTIVRALDDPALFQPYFRGSSWDGWRTILKAAFAIPLDEAELEFFHSVAGDRDPPERQVRELWWCVVGRRGGKDSIASVIAAYSAAMFTGQKHLRPGERGLVMCLACDRDQSRIVLNYTRSYFSDIPMLAALSGRNTAIGFELKNGVDVAVATNSFRSVRGRPVVCAIFDEVAFWRDETSSKPDEETLKAIIPALASIPNSMVIGISSPYRKSGLLYRKFKQHYGQDGDILVIKAPTRTLNPTIPEEVVDRALEQDPAAAKAEWLAEFRDDIGSWLAFETIEAAVDSDVTVRPPVGHFDYQSFCDPSGGARDSFTAAVAHGENGVAVLDCLIEVKPPFNPSVATELVAATLKSYGLKATTGDRYAAEWVVAAFAQCGIEYQHSERDRSRIYQDVMPLFTSGRARILDNKRLVNQFLSLERKTSSMGRDKIDHGPGGHDDLCNSASGALVLATTESTGPRLLWA